MIMKLLNVAAVLGAVAIGVTLGAWGQPLISTTGEVYLWVNSIWSAENSQQIADWYTLSHIIHGLLIALLGRALGRWMPYETAFALAIASGVAWEIVEHTDWVLDRFRGETIYQGYLGDTVLNAVCDYLFMLSGFAFATAVPWRWTVATILGFEILSASLARDSLMLTTIRVVYPIPALNAWQDETNPATAGATERAGN